MIKILFQCQIVITTPMELLKIALQDSGRVAASASLNTQAPAGAGATGATQAPPVKVKAPTATEIAMKVFKQKGFLGFYQGGTATLVRDVFFSAIYFPLFAYFNSMVRKYLPVFFDSFLTLKTLCFYRAKLILRLTRRLSTTHSDRVSLRVRWERISLRHLTVRLEKLHNLQIHRS